MAFEQEVVSQPADRQLGAPQFAVEIYPACAGYEGIGLISVHSCIAGLKILIYGEYRSTKVNIFKLLLDNRLEIWLLDDHGY